MDNHHVVAPVACVAATIGVFRYLSWRKKQWTDAAVLSKPAAATWLNQSQYDVLVAICDTLIPSIDPSAVTSASLNEAFAAMCPEITSSGILGNPCELSKHADFFARGAVAMNIPSLAAEAVQHFIPIEGKQDLALFLTLLSTSVSTMLISGYAVPFSHMSLSNRCAVLSWLRDHPVVQFRAAYQSFKRLCCSLFLSYANRGEPNPNWKHLNYSPISPAPNPAVPPALPTPLWGASPLSCDVVVIGSGAGGGVMAAELVKAGLSVILLDKGGAKRHDY